MPRYLTKSRYKMALDCPTKLYYSDKHGTYANSNLDDPFLQALAKGGFQVGALAKCYYPNGIEITSMDYDEAEAQTAELLKQENVVLFEAALKFKNLFIRVDILEKIGNTINLIEVKSKSADPNTFEDELWNARELKKNVYSLKSDWKSYIYDVAFQAFVAKNSLSRYEVNPFLMCADKSVTASVDGLNQNFIIQTDDKGRNKVETCGPITPKDLGKEILCKLDLKEVVEIIHQDRDISERFDGYGFEGGIWHFSEMYAKDEKIAPKVGTKCKGCEYRKAEEGKKCGFNECWTLAVGLTAEELKKEFVFDVWNFRGATKSLEEGKHLIEDLDETDFKIDHSKDGLSQAERQWLQVQKVKDGDSTPFVNVQGLAIEFDKWVFPLHMIDFETCMVALPFNKGRRPYEQIAFQFSHHLVHEDGTVEHKDEFINAVPGDFPNFSFVRALSKALSKDQGSIFRYSNHENTVLCQIREQLLSSNEPDKAELIKFIESVTTKKDGKDVLWEGPRSMFDLCELVKRYYYSPLTHGSNSIKYVLPAILNESQAIKEKYSQPIYQSGNFRNHAWIHFNDDGTIKDPYKTLPPIFDKYDYEELELVMSDGEIANGGAALTAYALMQFTHMSPGEREKICKGLLRYCELDTFAMVMIWEHWKTLIDKYKEEQKAA
jgi:hypothetical protein